MHTPIQTRIRPLAAALSAAIWGLATAGTSAGEYSPAPVPWGGPSPTAAHDPWRIVAAPHMWFSGIEGDITLRGYTADVDLGFDDLFDVTEYGFATHLELRREKYGFFISPSYAKMSGDGEGPNVAAEFEQDFWLVHGGGFYNLVQTQDARPLTVDLIAGLRYLNVSTDLDFAGLGPLGSTLSLSSSTELFDPMIGLRARKYLTEKISVALHGDIGGFGISEGNTSDLSWQAMALLGYDLSDRITIFGGYRGIGIDTSEGSGANEKGFDIIMHGALLGIEVKW